VRPDLKSDGDPGGLRNAFAGTKRHKTVYFFYAGAWPEHHCKLDEDALLNETIPKEKDGSYSKCKMYDNDDRNTTSKCSEWEYSDDVGYTVAIQVR